jgi:hypothetical protein
MQTFETKEFFIKSNITLVFKNLKTGRLSFGNEKLKKKLIMTFGNSNSIKSTFIPFKILVNKIFEKKKSSVAYEGDFFGNNFQSFETKSGIQIVDFLVGKGTSPSWGTFVKINYVSYITDKETIKKIESTFDKKETFTYQHGTGEINLAFEEGIHSMKIGGKRRIIIKIDSGTNIVDKDPIPSSSGKRQELKMFIKKNFENNNLFLIYDIELVEIFSQNI